ncbi:uncharacterized protein LOC115878255 [Sitophilus oryzae]|uniref:Uncharacterized protein LOC115878255 n=1 Tax=Sitophilus oryzae TaxID=7048 RepID=A0A6J2XHY4_SITOR|nr:uncharacterized protein LOC115878255 [Sitophilus oryzae]
MELLSFVVCFGLIGVALAKSEECGKIYSLEVSNDDEKLILNKHNELRKLIARGKIPGQPRGVNLKKMKYDSLLAAEAQIIANSCIFAHQTVVDGRWHAVGQNLYISYSTGYDPKPDWSAAIQAWFDEHKIYTYGSRFSKSTGHYTQMVWAKTEYVGCGYVYFSGNDFWKYKKLYVCNYGPAGNYIGEQPYQTGSSGCEDLCVTKVIVNTNKPLYKIIHKIYLTIEKKLNKSVPKKFCFVIIRNFNILLPKKMNYLFVTIILIAVYFKLGSGAGRIIAYGVSQAEQNAIVNIHNNFRKRIASGSVPGQPKGINLRRLRYDHKLALEAQKIANTTVFRHVGVKDSRFSVGQNLYKTSSTAAGGSSNWNGAITGWFNEYKSYKFVKCCAGYEKTGHYTQVVWATTQYVGCGYAYYYEAGKYPYNKFYVCNYGPAGNIGGSYPYKTGSSGCPNLC